MRLKIVLVNVLVALVAGLVSWFAVRGDVRRDLHERTENRVSRQRDLFERSKRLASIDLLEQVMMRASDPHVLTVFAETTPEGRRRVAWGECDAFAARLERPPEERGLGRKPEIVVITDNAGVAISRNLDPNALLNVNLAERYPAVRTALGGTPVRDVWIFRNGNQDILINVAVVPIRVAGNTVGTLVTGYDISAGEASEDKRRVGVDIAYFLDHRVYNSSLPNIELSSQLVAELFRQREAEIVAAVDPERRVRSKLFPIQLGAQRYVAAIGPLPQVRSNLRAGYVMLANLRQELAPADKVDRILGVTAGVVVLAIVLGLLLGQYLAKPIEVMEDGVLQVINGNIDHRIELKSSEYGALVYRINGLINVLTGVAEEEEEGGDESSEERAPPALTAAEARGAISVDEQAMMAPGVDDPAPSESVVAALSQEAEGQYYQRIFREYVQARAQTGEGNENITQDRFIEKLQQNERSLALKYGCSMVRFQVAIKNNRAVLRPIPIQG